MNAAPPSNDFGGQEPVANKDMKGICEARFGAKFTLTAKTQVKGSGASGSFKLAKVSS